jgi:hypothetical protein
MTVARPVVMTGCGSLFPCHFTEDVALFLTGMSGLPLGKGHAMCDNAPDYNAMTHGLCISQNHHIAEVRACPMSRYLLNAASWRLLESSFCQGRGRALLHERFSVSVTRSPADNHQGIGECWTRLV